MKTLIKNVCLILPDRLIEDAWLVACDGVIDDFGTEACPQAGFDRVIDGECEYLSPGFVDTHVHGGGGTCFHDGSEEAILNALRVHLKGGTTTILPTFTSLPHDKYLISLGMFARLGDSFPDMPDIPEVAGIHMEPGFPKNCTKVKIKATNITK